MKAGVKIALVLVAGVAILGYVYHFRTSRLTADRFIEIQQAQQRLTQAEAADKADTETAETDTEEPGAQPEGETDATLAADKKAAPATTAAEGGATPADPKSEPGKVAGYTAIVTSDMPDKAPEIFHVALQCTNGDVVLECHRDWAPKGVDRFYELVKKDFFTDMRIYRVVSGFVAQFGIPGDPAVAAKWQDNVIADDPVIQSNAKGTITFATSGPNSRTTQLFINYGDNRNLDSMGFAPFGRIVAGIDVADGFYSGYGESITRLQGSIQMQGNAFLDAQFPKLDSIKKAVFVKLNE